MRLFVELNLAGLDARQVERLGYQPAQPARFFVDDA